MVEIEPYDFQKKTNVKEHNDIVAKINEIVDVINNTNMDTIIPRIAKIETDISGINSTDALQWQDIESVKGDVSAITPKITKLEQDVTDINSTDAVQNTDITNLKAKDSEHDNRLGSVDTEIDGITKSLVSDVALMNGTTTGNVKVRIGRTDAPSIDSNDYNLQKPTSVELIQGSAPAMIKAQITLSDGTVLISDDFMFTTEAIGQDVYISSFVFKNGDVAGSISADIGLSNGSTLTANNFAVPTDPNVTSAISDLQGRVTTVENDVSGLKTTVNGHTTAINGLNSDVNGLKTTVNGHTTAINGLNSDVNGLKTTVDGHTVSINALDSDVANLQIDKADVSTVDTLTNAVNGKVNITQGINNAGKVLGINSSGNVEPTTVSSGGEEWEEVNLSSWPTDWVEGDRVKIGFKVGIKLSSAPTSWTSSIGTLEITPAPEFNEYLIEFIVNSGQIGINAPIINRTVDNHRCQTIEISTLYPLSLWNSSSSLFTLKGVAYNGSYCVSNTLIVTGANISTYAYKVYRLKHRT